MIAPAPDTSNTLCVAVVMRRENVQGPMRRWQKTRWVLADVVPNQASFGQTPRLLLETEEEQRWLHPAQTVALFRDEAEGYYLNASTSAPCWFVLWRMDEAPNTQASEATESTKPPEPPEPIARPVAVSLSYNEAGRWLDAQETVEQLPAPPEVVQWLQAFVDLHHLPEPKRRQRPESFKSLQDRFGSPAAVSTEKKKKNSDNQGTGPHHG